MELNAEPGCLQGHTRLSTLVRDRYQNYSVDERGLTPVARTTLIVEFRAQTPCLHVTTQTKLPIILKTRLFALLGETLGRVVVCFAAPATAN